jgi:hypothetical protein
LAGNLMLVPITMFLLRKFAGVSIRETFRRTWRIVLACLAMAGVVEIVAPDWVPIGSADALRQLLVIGAVGAATYGVVLFGLWRLLGKPEGPEKAVLQLTASRLRTLRGAAG